MAPDEQVNEEKPEEEKEKSNIDSEKVSDAEKSEKTDIKLDTVEASDKEEDLDTEKELDRLRFRISVKNGTYILKGRYLTN